MTQMARALVAIGLVGVLGGCSDDSVRPPDARLDAGVDAPRPDGIKPDGIKPDGIRPDGIKPDGIKPDGAAVRKRLDPLTIPKYKEAVVIPPVMPYDSKTAEVTTYSIGAKQFQSQMLPAPLPKTTVWGYGRASDPVPGSGAPSTFNSPAFTVEARSNEKVRVTWVNQLVDAAGSYLPHLLPVDQTIHWANPPGPPDSMTMNPAPYTGPVPLVTHVHGAHVPAISDGHPEAWFLPAAKNIPAGYSLQGTHYGSVVPAPAGSAVFEYPNTQRAMQIWYHDHALGITRVNVYAGLAGFWMVRDAVEDQLNLPGPAPKLGDAAGTRYYEVPLAIQDRAFHDDGSLFYPTSREDFDGYKGPYVPTSHVAPIWNPEFFGDTIIVNGKTWPYLEVEPRLYRLRFLNGCQARVLILKLDKPGLVFNQIGNEGGLLPDKPLQQTQLLLGPAERADVIVDFSSLKAGDEVTVLNVGPDEPFKGVAAAQPPADPQTTGQVMKLKVVALTAQGNAGVIPAALPAVPALTTTLPARDLTLHEEMDHHADIPIAAKLGTPAKGPLGWSQPVTEVMKLGDTEIWRVINLTADAHPIHLHLVHFQVLDRRPFNVTAYDDALGEYLETGGTMPKIDDHFTGAAQPAQPWEKGWKDTVLVNPGEVTRFISTFDLPGTYVWHCHILEHEDNEMMRPFQVTP